MKRKLVLSVGFLMLVLFVGNIAYANMPNLRLPFDGDIFWKVSRGYNPPGPNQRTQEDGESHIDWGGTWSNDIYALDFAGTCSDSWGKSIVAVANGTVAQVESGITQEANSADGYGNYVIIDHGNQYYSRYSHLSSVNVSVGNIVSQGDEIGKSGNTGYVIGSCSEHPGTHLHFSFFYNGEPIRPEPMAGFSNFEVDNWYAPGVGYFADGWHINTSQYIVDKYIEFPLILRKPKSNGPDGKFVHSLPREQGLPELYGQDFDGGMIVINNDEQKAYTIRGGFVYVYRGGSYVNPDGSIPVNENGDNIWGPNDLGAPRSDEVTETGGIVRQYFESGRLTYIDETITYEDGIFNIPTDSVAILESDVINYGSGSVGATGFGGGGPVPFPPPTNLVANPLSSSRVEARWDLVQDAVDYQVNIYDHSTGTLVNALNDTDGSVIFQNLTSNTAYELETKAIYLDGESNWTSRVHVTTLTPTQVNLESAELLTCESVQNLACVNPKSLFPYFLSSAHVYLKLANPYTDPLYFRFDVFDPVGNLAESLDRYGNFSPNPEIEWIAYAGLTGAIQSVANRTGMWRIDINYGYDINSINNFYTTYYFSVDEIPPPPADVPSITTEVIW